MTAAVMTYTINPARNVFKFVGKGIRNTFWRMVEAQARIGKARAAHHLAAMGYHEEAKKVMLLDY